MSSVHVIMGVYEGKRVTDPLDLELQAAVGYVMSLGTELQEQCALLTLSHLSSSVHLVS